MDNKYKYRKTARNVGILLFDLVDFNNVNVPYQLHYDTTAAAVTVCFLNFDFLTLVDLLAIAAA